MLKDKILERGAAAQKCDELRSSAKKIVFTNGVFDILHPGHVDYLCRARDLGDFLAVGLNTDASVKRLDKAPGRPFNSLEARAMVLAGLACIDLVVAFDEDTPRDLIGLLNPDILVKGDDYAVGQIAGHDLVTARGGKVLTIPLLKGYSTTALANRIKKEA